MSKLQNVEKVIARIAQEGVIAVMMSADPQLNVDAVVNIAEFYLSQAASVRNIVVLLEEAVKADLAALSAAEANPSLN